MPASTLASVLQCEGGVGGQRAELAPFCGDDVDGGHAVVGSVVYVPCAAGVEAVSASASPAALHELWQTTAGNGPPVVVGGSVWTISPSGQLTGLDPATGAVRQQAQLGREANHFPTPGVGAGLLLAPSADQVHAFAAATVTTTTSVAATTAPERTTTSVATTTTTVAAGSSASGWVAALVAALALAAAAAVLVLLRRRRR